MKTGIIHRWKIKIALIGVVFLLSVVPAKMGSSQENPRYGASSLESESGGAFPLLKDFMFVPGKVVLVEDRYILALYENLEKDLYALVLFVANCDPQGCTAGDLVAWSMFDAQGEDIRLASSLAFPVAQEDLSRDGEDSL